MALKYPSLASALKLSAEKTSFLNSKQLAFSTGRINSFNGVLNDLKLPFLNWRTSSKCSSHLYRAIMTDGGVEKSLEEKESSVDAETNLNSDGSLNSASNVKYGYYL